MRHSVRIGSTVLGLALAGLTGWATFGAAGCVVTSDTTTDDTGTPGDDTGIPPSDSGTTGGIRVKAASLVGSAANDVTALGKGSTYADIVAGGVQYAKAVITSGPTIPANPEFPADPAAIGKDAAGADVDATINNLAPGAYELQVKGYLKGVIGDLDAPPSTRIFIAQSTCTATVSAGIVTDAACGALQLFDASGKPWIKGIIFPSDFVGPSGGAAYAATTSGQGMDVWRARTPTSGTAAASVTDSDATGVIFIDETKFASAESTTARETKWSLTIEPKDTAIPTCTTAPGCTVTRLNGGTAVDLVVVDPTSGDHSKCVLNSTNTSTTACFQ